MKRKVFFVSDTEVTASTKLMILGELASAATLFAK